MRRRRRVGSGFPDHLATFDPELWSGPLLDGDRDRYGLALVGELTQQDLHYLARMRWLDARFQWAKDHGLPELLERVGARREHFGFPVAG